MNAVQLRAACNRAGSVSALARLIGKPRQYLQRRLRGECPVSKLDELAILKALGIESVNELTEPQPSSRAPTRLKPKTGIYIQEQNSKE